jgi:Sodium/hydrogen exchanger family
VVHRYAKSNNFLLSIKLGTKIEIAGIIGIHPIFGAFIVGLICPHEDGFAIKLTEKIEDLVSVLFLPLYFTLSGLSTNLGLLNDSKAWAYVIGVTSVAFAGKIIGGTLAARACRLVWRESLTIGVLMSCKGKLRPSPEPSVPCTNNFLELGLVELIVLVSRGPSPTNYATKTSRILACKPAFYLRRPLRFLL